MILYLHFITCSTGSLVIKEIDQQSSNKDFATLDKEFAVSDKDFMNLNKEFTTFV